MALAIDRYLVSTGHKQLFGSQASKLGDASCWCLSQVEPTFSDDLRRDYTARRLEDRREWVRTMNGASGACAKTECDDALQPTPKGSVPGVW